MKFFSIVAALAVLLVAAPAHAQTAAGTDKLYWDQAAPDLATAQSYRYQAYVDASAGVIMTATCTGTASPFVCNAQLPPLQTGKHTVSITAGIQTSTGSFAESSKAPVPPLPFELVVAPSSAANVRIAK